MCTVCCIVEKKRAGGRGALHISICLEMHSCFLFFLENTQDNSGCLCGGEQGAWGTEVEGEFLLHTIVNLKPCELKNKTKNETDN